MRTSIWMGMSMAAVVVAAAAGCGSESASSATTQGSGGAGGGEQTAGGLGPGGGADGGAGGVGPTLQTVRVTDWLANPAQGVDVLVHDADGGVVDHLTTGADGTVPTTVPPRGGITVAWTFRETDWLSRHFLRSTLSLTTDGEVPFVVPQRGTLAEAPPARLVLTGEAPTGAARVMLSASCSQFKYNGFELTSSTFEVTGLINACPGASTIDVSILATDPFLRVLSQARFLNLPIAANGDVVLNVPSTAFEPLDGGSHSLGGPLGYSGIDLFIQSFGSTGVRRDLALNRAFSTNIVDLVLPLPGEVYQVRHTLNYPNYIRTRERTLTSLPASDGASLATLKPLRSPSWDATNVARPTLSWFIGQAGEDGDGIQAQYEWYNNLDDDEIRPCLWEVYLPPTAEQVTLPEIPDGLETFRPSEPGYVQMVRRLDAMGSTGHAALGARELYDVHTVTTVQ